MELSLKRQLEQAEFTKTRGGGYDRTEVDDFLDRAVAMAAKVEARLKQVIADNEALGAGGSGGPAAPDPEAIEAEVARRVEAQLAEARASGSMQSEEEAAEQVRRTIVLAERTASEAVREAKEEAAQLLAEATERAEALTASSEERAASLTAESTERAAEVTTRAEERAAALTAEAEAAAQALREATEADAAAERQAARNRLAIEISEIEGAREALRSDVTILERHLEEQRTQLRSTVGELQRLLDDPTGFRMAPAPALLEPELPDLSDALEPPVALVDDEAATSQEVEAAEGEPELEDEVAEELAEAEVEAELAVVEDAEIEAEVEAEAEAELAQDEDAEVEAEIEAELDAADEAVDLIDDVVELTLDVEALDTVDPAPVLEGADEPFEPVGPEPLDFAVDHPAPGVDDTEGDVDAGPPTAPVAEVDLRADATRTPEEEDDAFLAELRKAMADEEPLGPRDHQEPSPLGPMFESDDRRGWRFGKRR